MDFDSLVEYAMPPLDDATKAHYAAVLRDLEQRYARVGAVIRTLEWLHQAGVIDCRAR